jgi:hypothetical protein
VNGPIAQIVALTCFGNAFLSGGSSGHFFPANSTCQFCERVAFVTLNKSIFRKTRETEIANNPDAWFIVLKSHGALGIRLTRSAQNSSWLSDRMSAGLVGGGGNWKMEVLFPGQTSEFWMARWEVGNQEAPDRRIWRVTYRCVSRARTIRPVTGDLAKATAALYENLKEIRAFSAKMKADVFTKYFDEALDTIASKGSNRHGYHQDLAPDGFLSGEAAMLLDACQKAWVFGGMGSWNDMGFDGEDQKTYERVSERLFQSINAAIVEAATSTMKTDLT